MDDAAVTRMYHENEVKQLREDLLDSLKSRAVLLNDNRTLRTRLDEAVGLLRAWKEQHAKLQGFPVAYEPYSGCKVATRAFLSAFDKPYLDKPSDKGGV